MNNPGYRYRPTNAIVTIFVYDDESLPRNQFEYPLVLGLYSVTLTLFLRTDT
jgi:hypothetical protein